MNNIILKEVNIMNYINKINKELLINKKTDNKVFNRNKF